MLEQARNAGGSGMSSIPLMNPDQVKVALELHRSRKGRKEMLTRGQRAILLLIRRVIRRMKERVLQLSLLGGLSPGCFFFFISCHARHLPSGSRCSKASCTGGQELRLAGYFLYLAYSLGAISFVCQPLSGPKQKRLISFV